MSIPAFHAGWSFGLSGGGFAGRLAYVRWLRSIGRQRPETDRELAQALSVGEKWFAKWKNSDEPPEGRSEADAIAAALTPMGVTIGWLYDNKGDPPRPDLWEVWTASPPWKRAAAQLGAEIAGSPEPPETVAPKRRARAVAEKRKPKRRR